MAPQIDAQSCHRRLIETGKELFNLIPNLGVFQKITCETDYRLVADFDDMDRFRIGDEDSEIAEMSTWHGILQNDIIELDEMKRPIEKDWDELVDPELMNIWSNVLDPLLDDHMGGVFPQEELNEISSQCFLILYCRALDASPRFLGERLLAIWRQGGYPCGWVGRYADGNGMFAIYRRWLDD